MKTYYTALVEHYFRLGSRKPVITNPVSARWYDDVWKFFNGLSVEDRTFLLAIFSKHSETIPTLKTYSGSFSANLSKLFELEQQFAERTNII